MEKYSAEFKQEVIEYAKKYSVMEAAKKYQPHSTTIRCWIEPTRYENRKLYCRQYHKENRDEDKQRMRRWYIENNEEICKEGRARYNNNNKERRKYSKNLRDVNRSQITAYERARYRKDPLFKLKQTIRTGVRRAITHSNVSKTYPSIKYLGCTIEQLREHIEKQFQQNMTWENHGRGDDCWHIDHIKPLHAIKDTDDIETIKEVCNYKNLQPLWEKDNLSKGSKIL